jgi:hypothetical protein
MQAYEGGVFDMSWLEEWGGKREKKRGRERRFEYFILRDKRGWKEGGEISSAN